MIYVHGYVCMRLMFLLYTHAVTSHHAPLTLFTFPPPPILLPHIPSPHTPPPSVLYQGNGYTQCMGLLMNYPGRMEVQEIVQLARHMRYPVSADLHCASHDTSRHMTLHATCHFTSNDTARHMTLHNT